MKGWVKTMFCNAGIHRWQYIAKEQEKSYRPMYRTCKHCRKRQVWNADLARSKGVIEWVDA